MLQGLGMGADGGQLCRIHVLPDRQTVPDLQIYRGSNVAHLLVQQLIGGNHRAGGGVLDGQDAKVDLSGANCFAYIPEGGVELCLGSRKQHPQGGLGIGATGALTACPGTGQRLDLLKRRHPGGIRQYLLLVAFANVHNGGKQRRSALGHIRRCHIPDPLDDLILPILLKNGHMVFFLVNSHLSANGHALCKGAENGFIQLVDLGTQCL